MDKIMESWYNKDIKKVAKYKHLIMLDLEPSELNNLSDGDDFVDNFNKEITELNERETFQSIMTYEEDQRKIMNTEKSISHDEGYQEGISNLAKALIEKGVPKDIIESSINSSLDLIEKEEKIDSLISYEEDQRKIMNTEKSISHDEGYQEGILEGKVETKIEIAKNLKNLGMSLNDIATSCDLSIEEIKNI